MSKTEATAADLSVVVLAWNQLDLTKRCVASIKAHTDVPYELIIVDNGSAAEAASWAKEAADVAVLHDTNLGFAMGMNAGLEVAGGDAIAFVNNDTEMPEVWASRLLQTLRSPHPPAGIVVPAVTSAGNRSTVRTKPSADVAPTSPFRDLPSGVVYVMDTAVMRSLGGWTELYPVASAEDLDLLFTVWSNALEVVLDERVLVQHVGGATADTELRGKGRLWRNNRNLFVDRWSDIADSDVARLPGVDEGHRHSRLEQARIAATWMKRAFEAEDRIVTASTERRAGELRATIKAEETRAVEPTPPASFIHRIRRLLRNR